MARTPRSSKEHRERGPKSVTTAIITVSDTRTTETDESGRAIKELLEVNGHRVVRHIVCKDEPLQLNKELDQILALGIEAVLINGGTGVAPRDVTTETISPRLEKKIEGFGELFRLLSYKKIGSAAMLSRAVAGIHHGAVIFCLPGSPDAVRLALDKLILPELSHIVGLARS